MSSSISSSSGAVSRPLLVLGYSSARSGRNVFQDVLGSGVQDVTLVAAGLRSGTLTYLFASESEAAACERLHAGTDVLTLADTDLTSVGMSYVLAGTLNRSLDSESRTLWTVSVDYREVTA